MQFRDFVENLLGSKVKFKIIRYFLTQEALTSERELAQLIGVSHSAVNRAIKDLQDSNLITPMRIGTAMIWNLNKYSYAYILLAYSSFKDGIKKLPLEELKSDIKKQLSAYGNVKKAILFGSIAEGRELPNSDIDIFVIVDVEKGRADLKSFWDRHCTGYFLQKYGNTTSLSIFTEKDIKDPKNKKFLENVNRGIVVFEK